MVLLHAGIADRTMWADVVGALAAAGYRAIAIDLPGFGEAPAAPGHAPHRAVLDTMDALDVGRAALVGSSFGGAVSLRLAVTAPDRVRALALVSTPAPGTEASAELRAAWKAEESALDRGDVEGAVAAVVDAWTLPGAPARLRDRIAAMQRRAFALQGVAGEATDAEDPLDEQPDALQMLDIPALVAVGELDMPDFRLGAQALAQQLRYAQLVVIPGARHLAPLEQPAAFCALLLDYLGDVPDDEDRR
ncbi:MAG TPA: alpha/beta hydrolase [Solirubrobacteraceae bacterium]|nr:alpha/beta hydrolase [Solirubrobacteraceae bacterium]